MAGVFRNQSSQMNERSKVDWGATVAKFSSHVVGSDTHLDDSLLSPATFINIFSWKVASLINKLLPAKGISCTKTHDKSLGYLKQNICLE